MAHHGMPPTRAVPRPALRSSSASPIHDSPIPDFDIISQWCAEGLLLLHSCPVLLALVREVQKPVAVAARACNLPVPERAIYTCAHYYDDRE